MLHFLHWVRWQWLPPPLPHCPPCSSIGCPQHALLQTGHSPPACHPPFTLAHASAPAPPDLTLFLLLRAPLPPASCVQPLTFHTPLGRAVHAFFFDPKQRGPGVPVAELFLPRWVRGRGRQFAPRRTAGGGGSD